MSSCYDLIIVGAGPAGLRTGIQTLKQYPSIRCCILEKYNYIGGRVVTYHKNIPSIGNVQWENGAGRISKSHKRVRQLIQQYGLHFAPMSGKTLFLSKENQTLSPDIFYQFHNLYFKPLELLPKEILGTHTLYQLLTKTIGHEKTKEFVQQFPYYSEIHVLRADLALEAFRNEMNSNHGFGVCVEGYQAITQHMFNEFTSLGGTVIKNIEVTDIRPISNIFVQVICKEKDCQGQQTNTRILSTNAIVLALHLHAIKQLKGFHLPMLRHLEMPPLLRIYAIFPKQHGKVWFQDLPKIVTNSRLRFIIPINVQKGIIMVSYTEGPDAMYWMNKTPHYLQQNVLSELQSLFPTLSIPHPLFFKTHPWTDGCTYWKPGHYDPQEESMKSLQPLPDTIPNLFMCGESFSLHQSWVESALEQADKLIDLPAFHKRLEQL